jgi:hypothetical protein
MGSQTRNVRWAEAPVQDGVRRFVFEDLPEHAPATLIALAGGAEVVLWDAQTADDPEHPPVFRQVIAPRRSSCRSAGVRAVPAGSGTSHITLEAMQDDPVHEGTATCVGGCQIAADFVAHADGVFAAVPEIGKLDRFASTYAIARWLVAQGAAFPASCPIQPTTTPDVVPLVMHLKIAAHAFSHASAEVEPPTVNSRAVAPGPPTRPLAKPVQIAAGVYAAKSTKTAPVTDGQGAHAAA